MRLLVLGANGMAGHLISYYLMEKGFDVLPYARTSSIFSNKTILGDAFDLEHLKSVLIKNTPDVVINCIGILNKDAEQNKAKAIYLNSYLPHFLANFLQETNTRLIQMSTDCVFNGNTGPYYENTFPDGKTFYDRTKALGEIDDGKNLTFRNSIIGPDVNISGIGLFNWFMKQHGSINGYTKAIWTGVTTLTLAKAMEKAIETKLTGLYNLVNNSTISKCQLLMLFNKYFRNNSIMINEDSSFCLDKTLINTRKDFDFIIPSYEQMISEMYDWVSLHKQLYLHYQL